MKKLGACKESANYLYHQELGGIGILDASYHRQCFSRHSHEGYTFGVIERGTQKFLRSGSSNLAPAGSIILINADDIHNGQANTDDGWAYKALYPLPEHFERLSHELVGTDTYTPYFPDAVVHDAALAKQFRYVFSVLERSENKLLRESLLYALLTRLMRSHGKRRVELPVEKKATKKVSMVKHFLDDSPSTNISLSDLAQMVSLNPYYLVRAFNKEFGIPPHAYQLQARIRYAEKLIRQGYPLADVSNLCGFHDQSHFTKHFKRVIGVTPSQYARHFLR
ncbi:AraC family transcriptional regulator [Salinivibrio proteolyticus]|uniref:AraC family transcriptional regulator n=1 Tax=Salinivibrio proteolyticus TaxID=334715 RepID=UPI00098938D7|nr:AraC family transcriptional regulator [Salinivibrio proteolyticus]OOF29808.1 AraC family transcriptional regulator [Salinivibrio proteolyticus]